jgi:hypothetical protein
LVFEGHNNWGQTKDLHSSLKNLPSGEFQGLFRYFGVFVYKEVYFAGRTPDGAGNLACAGDVCNALDL